MTHFRVVVFFQGVFCLVVLIIRLSSGMPRADRCAVVCFASPLAAVKIKGNNQQITQHFTHSLFFVRFYVSAGWWRGELNALLCAWTLGSSDRATKSSPFLSRNIILPPEGVMEERCTFSAKFSTPWGKWSGGSWLAQSTWTKSAHDRMRVSASSS